MLQEQKFFCFILYAFFFLTDLPNQCSPNPCHKGGTITCEDLKGGFACQCKKGWKGRRCEQGEFRALEARLKMNCLYMINVLYFVNKAQFLTISIYLTCLINTVV